VLEPTLTVIVDALPAVTEAGLKPTVVPVGWPLALRATVWAEPLVTAVLIVEVPLPPCAMPRLLGLALIEKSDGGGGAVTVRLTVVVWVALVPVPVTVIVYVPVAVVEPTLTVIDEELPAVTDAGLKLLVVPVGSPLELKLTGCAEPLVTAVPIVDVPLAPCCTLMLLGFALIEKSFGGGVVTVRLTVVVWVKLVPVPVTVIG
jgi:hypothetical protein